MTLTGAQMEKLLEEDPEKDVGEVWFDCPNCGKKHHETIFESAWEVDEDGKLFYDCPTATTVCDCGASILVAWQPDGEGEMYWLNKEKMQHSSQSETHE